MQSYVVHRARHIMADNIQTLMQQADRLGLAAQMLNERLTELRANFNIMFEQRRAVYLQIEHYISVLDRTNEDSALYQTRYTQFCDVLAKENQLSDDLLTTYEDIEGKEQEIKEIQAEEAELRRRISQM